MQSKEIKIENKKKKGQLPRSEASHFFWLFLQILFYITEITAEIEP